MLRLTVLGRPPAGCTPQFMKRCIAAALLAAGRPGDASVAVRFVSDEEMTALNAAYRGKKKTTDVLSFAAAESPVPLPPEAASERGLGDIVVSLPQVRRQAKAVGRPALAELALMLVHGTLHLLGYDHATVRQERKMFSLQHDALIEAGIF